MDPHAHSYLYNMMPTLLCTQLLDRSAACYTMHTAHHPHGYQCYLSKGQLKQNIENVFIRSLYTLFWEILNKRKSQDKCMLSDQQ